MHPKTCDQALSHVREHAVDVAFGNAADVHLDIRQGGALEAVLQCEAGIGKPSRVHHQAVEALIDGAVDAIDRLALDVAVEDFEIVAMLPSVTLSLASSSAGVMVP